MRVLAGLLLGVATCGAQMTPLGGVSFVSTAPGTTVVSGNTGEGQSCASGGGESGGATCILPVFTISHAGSAVYLHVAWCEDSECSTTPAAAVTATDNCGNIYTQVIVHLQNSWSQVVLVASNAGAGSCTISLSQAGHGLWYTRWLLIECIGADKASPVDSAVSKTANGTGTAVSITSAGVTTAQGELVIADFDVTNPSNTGTCTTLQTDNASFIEMTASPAPGTPITCSLTESSANWWSTIIGIQP